MATTDSRLALLAPLGYQRMRLIACLGGDMPRLPQYFSPRPGADVFSAFRAFVAQVVQLTAADQHPLTRSLVAAGRLLTGEVSAALDIVEHLPAKPFPRDHGAGQCLVAPVSALAEALPLPSNLPDCSEWLAGSNIQSELREWLTQHEQELVWDELPGRYRFRSSTT